MKLSLICLLFSLLISASERIAAEEDSLLYIYEPELRSPFSDTFRQMLSHANNNEFDLATNLSDVLLEAHLDFADSNPVLYGQLMVNHGIVRTAATDYEVALPSINDGLKHLESRTKPFSVDLIRGLMAKAIAEFSLDQNTEAEDTFRRVQHIVHRNQGVYASSQLSALSWITKANLKRGEVLAADREQRFTLRVAEQSFGSQSVEIVPFLTSIGAYFASRGSTIPTLMQSDARLQRDLLFRRSVDLYQRAVRILETTYGEDDIRLVKPLRGLAHARLLQVTNRKRAEAALTRSLKIVNNHSGSDLTDRAIALVDLGDFYTIMRDEKASPLYLEAWNKLQEDEQTRAFAAQLFALPERLFPSESDTLFLDRRPDAADEDEELFVNLEYSVTAAGTVKSVRVIDKNVPNEQVRILRYQVRNALYRPRIEDGELVATEGLTFYQPFSVSSSNIANAPSTSNDILTAPESAPHKQMAR